MNLKKILGGLVLAAACVLPISSAQAAEVDLNTLPCAAFNAMGESQPFMIFWFHGYTVAMQEGEVFDDAKITKFATELVSFCQKTPSALVADGVIAAANAAQ